MARLASEPHTPDREPRRVAVVGRAPVVLRDVDVTAWFMALDGLCNACLRDNSLNALVVLQHSKHVGTGVRISYRERRVLTFALRRAPRQGKTGTHWTCAADAGLVSSICEPWGAPTRVRFVGSEAGRAALLDNLRGWMPLRAARADHVDDVSLRGLVDRALAQAAWSAALVEHFARAMLACPVKTTWLTFQLMPTMEEHGWREESTAAAATVRVEAVDRLGAGSAAAEDAEAAARQHQRHASLRLVWRDLQGRKLAAEEDVGYAPDATRSLAALARCLARFADVELRRYVGDGSAAPARWRVEHRTGDALVLELERNEDGSLELRTSDGSRLRLRDGREELALGAAPIDLRNVAKTMTLQETLAFDGLPLGEVQLRPRPLAAANWLRNAQWSWADDAACEGGRGCPAGRFEDPVSLDVGEAGRGFCLDRKCFDEITVRALLQAGDSEELEVPTSRRLVHPRDVARINQELRRRDERRQANALRKPVASRRKRRRLDRRSSDASSPSSKEL